MDERLKERLTGAAILVMLVAWLLPEMFRGRPLPVPTSSGLAAASAGPATNITFGVAPESAVEPEMQPPPATVAVTAPSAEAVAEPMAPVAASLPLVEVTPPAPKPDVAPTPRPVVMPAVTPAPAVKASATQASAAKPATAGWVVQVGSFTERANAQRMVQQGARKGFKLQVAGPDDRGYFRVRTAVLRDRAAASSLQARLKTRGLKGVISSAP